MTPDPAHSSPRTPRSPRQSQVARDGHAAQDDVPAAQQAPGGGVSGGPRMGLTGGSDKAAQPGTAAGRALLSMFPLYGERIAAIEAEAVAELRAEVEEAARASDKWATGLVTRDQRACWQAGNEMMVSIAKVLALVDCHLREGEAAGGA